MNITLTTLLRPIDEDRLWTFPVMLGRGQRLFGDGSLPSTYELIDVKATGTGAAVHSFRAGGAPTFGSFPIEDGTETTITHPFFEEIAVNVTAQRSKKRFVARKVTP